jgi:thiol-disulfide isomerase/thioredoxin
VALILLSFSIVIGDSLPPIDLSTSAGERVRLRQERGRPLVIDFFATWCGPCRQSLPVLERLRQQFGDRVDFVSIAEDEDGEKVAAFAAEMKLGGRVLVDVDQRAFRRLGAHRLPTTYLVDSKGVVQKINHGFGSGYEARMTKWIQLSVSGAER